MKYIDDDGKVYDNEPNLRINQLLKALQKKANADRISLVEIVINGNGIIVYRETVHHNGTKTENELLNIKGEFIPKHEG